MVTIQHIQADLDQGLPSKEDQGPDAPATPTQEVWSEEGLNTSEEDSLGWETQTDDTWDIQKDEEGAANDLALLDHFNFLPVGEQQGLDNSGNVDPFVLAREVVAGFEQRNVVFRDIELPTPIERSHPLIISMDVNDYLHPGVLFFCTKNPIVLLIAKKYYK